MTIPLALGNGTSVALPPTDKGPAVEPVSGLAADGALLTGYFKPNHFAVDQNGNLSAIGSLTGTVSRSGAMQSRVDQQITLPVDRQPTAGGCRMVDVAVGPEDLNVAGESMHMDEAMVNISTAQGPGSRLEVPMCTAGELMKGPPAQTNPALAAVLNQMLALLGQGG